MAKTKPAPGLQFHAARYYGSDGSYDIVLYPWTIDDVNHPHDWDIVFTPQEWRRMGGELPPEDGSVEVRLAVLQTGKAAELTLAGEEVLP